MTCLYSMKPADLDAFYAVATLGSANLDQVAQSVSRDRSTAHRSLSKLVSAGLVYKQTRTLKDGGYYHVYSTVDPSTIKEHASQKAKEISDGFQKLIERFPADFQAHLTAGRRASG
ncbi:MAG TPA: helix-turn-helix domain-containing protein [Nitrososphaerales archaeon]|nr:helix-turn-helix domain-containing protein [Nitrososphaerales archaeon]